MPSFNPSLIERAINVSFARDMAEMQAARSLAPGIMDAMLKLESSGAYEKLNFLGAMPGVQQWIGEVEPKTLASYEYTVKNLNWEASTTLSQDDIEDDQTGVLQMSGAMLARLCFHHPEDLAIDLLMMGDQKDAYDGQKFFSDTAAAAKGKLARTFDNLLDGSGTTLAQLEADLNKGLIALAKIEDDNGRPLNFRGSMIVCASERQRDFERLILSDTDATAGIQGVRNPYKGLTVIGSPLLSKDDVDDWYLLATEEKVKPLIFSDRMASQVEMWKKPGTKTWTITAHYRGNGAYGLPQLAVKVVN